MMLLSQAERYRAQLSCHYSISRYVVTAENDNDAVFCDTANAFSVNAELSVLTHGRGRTRSNLRIESAPTAKVATPS